MRRLVATVTRAAVTLAAVMLAGALASPAALASDRPLRIVAFGDSLTAGYGLPADAAFPAKLERALAAKGIAPATPPPAASRGSTGRSRTAPRR
jgi:lysophospholipase L1-like esterase